MIVAERSGLAAGFAQQRSWMDLAASERRGQNRRTLLRHCEQSEAIQTWGLRRRLSLDRFAVARDDDAGVHFKDGEVHP